MKKILFLLITASILIAGSETLAARASDVTITEIEKPMTAEVALSSALADRSKLASKVNLARLDDHRRNRSIRLSPAERRSAGLYERTIARISFWQEVVGLKEALVSLHGEKPPAGAVAEADMLARNIIEKTHELTRRWDIGNSALIHNALVNAGRREKGFCYHFAAELRKVVASCLPSWHDSHWGSAWEGSYRESNALVITAKGKPFESGIAVDPWRTAGRPFWTPVKGDRFPWVEGLDVEKNYDVE